MNPVDPRAPQNNIYMAYETLKEQWSDVEERDGVRLSWNTFPSSRMVSACPQKVEIKVLILGRKPLDSWFQLAQSTRR